jgi:hypothetical protein
MLHGTEKVFEFEMPPPGDGLETVTAAPDEISLGEICAVTRLLLINEV